MNISSNQSHTSQFYALTFSALHTLSALLCLSGCLPSPPPGPPPTHGQTPPPSQELLNQALADVHGWNPNLCEPEAAFARGMSDAKAGKEMNLSFVKLCSTALKESNESQYKKGYAEGK